MTTTSTTQILSGVEAPAPGVYAIDPSHSNLGVTARHLMISKVRGFFSGVAGSIVIADDPLASSVELTVQADTIDTRDAQRDGHLKGDDFLDVENHPELTFRSTRVEQVKNEKFRVTGDLTIRGVTKPVVLDGKFLGLQSSQNGAQRLGFEATTTINRLDYGVKWNRAAEGGGVMLGDDVKIDLFIEALKPQQRS